jgi:Sulfatase-modifying factor enzyme 1
MCTNRIRLERTVWKCAEGQASGCSLGGAHRGQKSVASAARAPRGAAPLNRVLRGGSWINNAQNLRSANRNHNHPDNANQNIGLRLVLSFAVTTVGPANPSEPKPLSGLQREVSRCGKPQDTRCVSSKGLDERFANAHRAVDILVTDCCFWGGAR